MSTSYPVISLKPSYNSVIRGCPGIPSTLPRIECQLQIRANNGLPLKLDKVIVSLKTIEKIHTSINLKGIATEASNEASSPHVGGNSNSYVSTDVVPAISIGSALNSAMKMRKREKLGEKKKSSKYELVTVHYKKTIKLKPEQNGSLIGIDLPLTIGLPDGIKETNYNKRYGSCLTVFKCEAYYNGGHIKEFECPINVERYTYLPSEGHYFTGVTKSVYSPDKRFKVDYRFESTSLSTDDTLKLSFEFRPTVEMLAAQSPSTGSNRTSRLFTTKKAIKLKSVTVQLKELLQLNGPGVTVLGNRGVVNSKENIIHEQVVDINQTVSTNAIKMKVAVPILTKDKYFKSFELVSSKDPADFKASSKSVFHNSAETVLLQSKNVSIPLQFHDSITTIGAFFSIFHHLTLRFKVGSGRFFEVNQNVTISRHPRGRMREIEQLIDQERETAVYAMQFYTNFGGIVKKRHPDGSVTVEYPVLPPVLYRGDDPAVLDELGIKYEGRSFRELQRVPIIE